MFKRSYSDFIKSDPRETIKEIMFKFALGRYKTSSSNFLKWLTIENFLKYKIEQSLSFFINIIEDDLNYYLPKYVDLIFNVINSSSININFINSKIKYINVTNNELQNINDELKKKGLGDILKIIQQKNIELIGLVLTNNVDIVDSTGENLYLKVGNNSSLIKILDEKGVNANKIDSKENTLLHLATRIGNIDLINYSLQIGINIDALNAKGETALHIISEHYTGKNTVILRHLISNNANINIINNDNKTSLMLAVKSKNMYAVSTLLEKGACLKDLNINSVCENSHEGGRLSKIKKLLEASKIIDEYINGDHITLPYNINLVKKSYEEIESINSTISYQDLLESRITDADEEIYNLNIEFFISRWVNLLKNNGVSEIYQYIKNKLENNNFSLKNELIEFVNQLELDPNKLDQNANPDFDDTPDLWREYSTDYNSDNEFSLF